MGKSTRKLLQDREAAEQQVVDFLRSKKKRKPTKRPVRASEVMTREMRDRSHLWVRQPSGWTYPGKTTNEDKHKIALARHLFAKYPCPRFLEQAWNQDDQEHINWYIAVTQGKSLYKQHLRGILSKKETHLFLQAPSNYAVGQALWWAKAVGFGADRGIANRIVTSSLLRRGSIADEFWISVMRFFIRNPVSLNEMDDLMDYLAYARQENENYSMKGRSLESVRRHSEVWHRAALKAKQIAGGSWEGMGLPNWWIEFGEEHMENYIRYTVTEITTGDDLFKEGQKMRHCVAWYKPGCINGKTSIFSMQSKSYRKGSARNLTIEVHRTTYVPPRIVQARGYANRMPRGQEARVLRRWASRYGLQIACQLS